MRLFDILAYLCNVMVLKKALKYIFTALSVFYFLFAGTGYNIVQYCCGDCADAGVEMFSGTTCSTVHHAEEDACCDTEHTEAIVLMDVFPNDDSDTFCHADKSCELVRVETDVFSVNSRVEASQIDLAPLFFAYFESLHLSIPENISAPLVLPPPDILMQSGRSILSHKAVLII